MRTTLLSYALLGVSVHAITAIADTSLADCAAIADSALRLACYDGLAQRQAITPEAELTIGDIQLPIGEPPAGETLLLAESALQEDTAIAQNPRIITPHHRNYLLPVSYNNKLNDEAWSDRFPDDELMRIETKFQLSLKALVWEEVLGDGSNLWAGYTQQSWWQLYNESSPFRETNYQPEIFLTFANDWEILGFTNTILGVGINHQSNGKGGDLSRSWNRVLGQAIFERDRMTMSLRSWYRIPEDENKDDNPDIEDYYGYGDLTGLWKWREHEFSVMLRNNLQQSDNRGAVQLEWTFPITPRFRGYIQYFNGYGESLIDYDQFTNRLGIGISLTDIM